MKRKNLFKGSLILVAGGTILIFVAFQYARYKEISLSDLIRDIFPDNVENILVKEDRTIYLSTSTPETLQSSILEWAEEDYILVYFSDEIDENAGNVVSPEDLGDYDMAWRKYYVPVVSVESFLVGITTENFESLLAGNAVGIEDVSYELVIGTESRDYIDGNYTVGVSVPTSSDVVNQVYENPSKIGFISFDQVTPKVKVISIDGNNLLSDYDGDSYPFVENVWVKDYSSIGLFEKVQEILGDVNYDPNSVSTVVVTGTSVMGARGLFQKSKELGDPIYPIREVAEILSSADISHVSNEAAFVDGCEQGSWSLVFCGTLDSFEAFTYAGIDVVGLTGNHVLDYGNENFVNTLELFEDNEIKYFGGGRNFTEAHTPAVETVNGMTFAFLGYNNIPPVSAFATNTEPGSAELDMNQMITDIESAASQYDFTMVDMQWGNEYEHDPLNYQMEYGRAAIDAGADIVTGVHPHWVQKLEYYRDGVIFYGIGNLLFDQMWSQKTREGLMVRHYFHKGSHIGFDLLPTIIYEGAQPRPVTGADAQRIINYLF